MPFFLGKNTGIRRVSGRGLTRPVKVQPGNLANLPQLPPPHNGIDEGPILSSKRENCDVHRGTKSSKKRGNNLIV